MGAIYGNGCLSRRLTPFLIHYSLYLLSFLFGVLTVKFNYITVASSNFSQILSNAVNGTYLDNFLSSFVLNVAITVLICLSGYFVFGSVISVAIFMTVGLGNGTLFALTCSLCGAIGIAVNFVLLLLPTLLMFLLLTVISTSSLYFSSGLAVAVFSNRALIGIKSRMNDMLLLLLLAIPCTAVIAAFRALFILIFSGVFFA